MLLKNSAHTVDANLQKHTPSSLSAGNPAALSRRERLERSLDSISAFIHDSMNSIWLGVASASWSARTWRVRGSRLARVMIVAILSPVDARLRFMSGMTTGGRWVPMVRPPSFPMAVGVS